MLDIKVDIPADISNLTVVFSMHFLLEASSIIWYAGNVFYNGFLHMFKMPIFQRIAIMLDQSITLLPFLHMYHSIFLRGRHHLHWIMLPSWPRYHKLYRISDFYQHHQRTLVMKKSFFPFYCFTPAKILLVEPTISSAAMNSKCLLMIPYMGISIRTWLDVKVNKLYLLS